jgi:hypothetical protein
MDSNFRTVDWAEGASIYEVNIRQYTVEGTFKAFEAHIERNGGGYIVVDAYYPY